MDQHICFNLFITVCFILQKCISMCQITYIETSAKDPPMNVDKAFHELVRVIR